MTFYEELKERGVVKDVSSPDLEEKLNNESLTFYIGTDPTADSLHIGHYASFVTAKRLMLHGHKPIVLVGGATGLIGDPRPTAEREIISKETVEKNILGLTKQVSSLLDNKATIVNNYDWTKDVTFLDFLRDIGKYINVNYMLNKDIISRRLDSGITYAEFSYTLLQGYDFLHLYQDKNCVLQAAGSDQWGNITTGIELIRKILGKEAYGFTMPLILDKQGHKFGKSEGNALWLDKEKTSPYKIYQYLLNSDDTKVEEYLKVFTFLTLEEISEVMKEQNAHPETRVAQKTLAYEVVKDLHGKIEADIARQTSLDVFSGKINDDMPTVKIEDKELSLVDLLVKSNLAPSKSEARRLIIQGGIKVNNEKMTYPDEVITINDTVVSKGKKNIIKVTQ